MEELLNVKAFVDFYKCLLHLTKILANITLNAVPSCFEFGLSSMGD